MIALGLPMLLYMTGGTDELFNYAVLFVSIIAMSVFFSVHNMVLYYLLQPYNTNLESAFGFIRLRLYFIRLSTRLPSSCPAIFQMSGLLYAWSISLQAV